ncbi:hypothetical protein CTEN210_00260 [Chaetoceros tenuissimus]|uniref:Leucine rich repeats-containing protein n=1 Tax=Chaetoceros tenuissimus TaxID=426638 RepID=A0AAD3GY88_9STRA|nr:hypothetical protein CTEN210_00260 [Chaetoceros tenuissimus]
MRVATVDGLVTLFYDGSEELWNPILEFTFLITGGSINLEHNSEERAADLEAMNVPDSCKRYYRERQSWQQIIIVEGVTVIPERTFCYCFNIQRVIFANTVIRIEKCAFAICQDLVFIKWSMSLQYIGPLAFEACNLSSVFIPPTCQEICREAFNCCNNLSILHVPRQTALGENVFRYTALVEASPFDAVNDDTNQWLKNMNNDEAFSLHRACSSFQPLKEVIHTILQEKGLKAFREENSAGITPSRYLQENPYTNLTEKEIIHDYLMKMIGEVE